MTATKSSLDAPGYRCFYCGGALDPDAVDTMQRVVGWGRKHAVGSRRAVSTNIEARELRNEFAHDNCVRRIKRGIAPAQEALL